MNNIQSFPTSSTPNAEEWYDNLDDPPASWLSHIYIQTWANDVDAATSIYTNTKSKNAKIDLHTIIKHNCFLRLHRRIPRRIADQIRKKIDTTIGRIEIYMILHDLPHPTKYPLTIKNYPHPPYIEIEYKHLMEIRDLFCIQQLLLEKPQFIPSSSECPAPLLEDVLMMIRSTEESIAYVIHWAMNQGWDMDFDLVEERRQKARDKDHPCNLLLPFINKV
ncbi:hypothetical protein BDZ94DRAFT_1276510, partial [Collybia nuda]